MSSDPHNPYGVRPSAPDADTRWQQDPERATSDALGQPPLPPTGTPRSWRARGGLTVFKGVGAALFLAAGVWSASEPVALAVGVAGAVVLGALVVRDLVARVRLSADRTGVTVLTGFARRRHLPWSEVERVRVDRRSRFGVASELVEIDAGEELYLFSANELGEPCDRVVRTLDALRP